MAKEFIPIPIDEDQEVVSKKEFIPIPVDDNQEVALKKEFTPIPVDPEVLEAEEPKNEADTYEGFLAEVGEGIVSGTINIFTGPAELIAEGIDLAADTSYAKTVHDTVEEFKESMGIDPEGAAGTFAEGIVQFGVPGLAAASAVSKISKFGKMGKQFSRGKKVGGFGEAAKYNKYKKYNKLMKYKNIIQRYI